jgi:ribosomal protein L32
MTDPNARRPTPEAEAAEEDEGYFDPEGPGEHDHHLLDDDTEANDYVNCAQCGEQILAFAERCPSCGHFFTEGEAWQHAEDEAGLPKWLIGVVALVVIALLLWIILP